MNAVASRIQKINSPSEGESNHPFLVVIVFVVDTRELYAITYYSVDGHNNNL